MDEILRIEDLRVEYRDRDRMVRAVDGVDLSLRRGETLSIVGESGCGKTTLALAILDLVASPGRITSGSIRYDGRELLGADREELRAIRGNDISMIFQDPIAGLNPVLTIGAQVEEMIRAHTRMSKRECREAALDALRQQGLPDAKRVFDSYAFQLSGGMAQRVMIAIATVLRPSVILADEPTSSLDVTVQAAILRELNVLKEQLGASILLITHDLGVVARMADRVAVMYAGRIIEQAAAVEAFNQPRHPYTAGLLAARPRIDRPDDPLLAIKGSPPEMSAVDDFCAFLPRCSKALTRCRTDPWPALEQVSAEAEHDVRCYNPMFQPAAEPVREG